MEQLKLLWENSRFTPPDLLLGLNLEGDTFLILTDDATIINLMTTEGKIYAVAKFRCQVHPEGNAWICGNPMHVISCKKIHNPKYVYAKDVILPYLNELLQQQ
ncbi:unnamed protein product [marine sediment metagenome]|uniref:Uncharacterized protein n=1 Tax=marine sediment metagenome TaxID=412755 RepID=X1IMP9_9ZZZZ